jgi:urea carboxylase-associated protein 1
MSHAEPISPERMRMLDYLRARAAALGPGEIRARFHTAAAELEALLAEVDEGDARHAPADGGWSIARVADHLAQTTIRSAEELRHLLAGRRPPEPPVYDALGSGAPAWVPWTELRAGVRAANAEFETLLAAAAAAQPPPDATIRTILVVSRAGGPSELFAEDLDWKAYALVQRLHLLDHRNQVRAARAALARPAPEPAPASPGRVVEDRTVPAGGEWSGRLTAGQVLRLVDLEGRQAIDFLCYAAADPGERYNAADTLKLAGTLFLTTGHGLYSDMGRRLFTIVADTCGRHDTVGGCCSAESNRLRYGVEGTPNCRDNFLRALARLGLGKKDIVANVNFFMNVPVGPDGALSIAEGRSRPGDYVDLRAETDVLVALSNCPQVYNPASGGRPTPIRLVIYEP